MAEVFFSRCRPQGCDAVDVALKHHVVFVGYPVWKAGVAYRDRDLHSCMVDVSCSDEEWSEYNKQGLNFTRSSSQNRNLAREIQVGDIVLVPRPDRGFVYAARVASAFEHVSNPQWLNEYYEIRNEQGVDCEIGNCHAGDVSQIWRTSEYVPLPIVQVPGWIRASLFGRSTVARVRGSAETGDAHQILGEMMKGARRHASWAPTTDIVEIEQRLKGFCTPQVFEHLVVSLLQLENPDQMWSQVGGSGDGGVDGLSFTRDGELASILQCKYVYHSGTAKFGDVNALWEGSQERYFACLLHPKGIVATNGVELLTGEDVARLVLKHRERLPEAISLGIV